MVSKHILFKQDVATWVYLWHRQIFYFLGDELQVKVFLFFSSWNWSFLCKILPVLCMTYKLKFSFFSGWNWSFLAWWNFQNFPSTNKYAPWKSPPVSISKLLTPGVNSINILCAHFVPIFWCQKISNPKHSLEIFGAKILYKKRKRKKLMKLTTG